MLTNNPGGVRRKETYEQHMPHEKKYQISSVVYGVVIITKENSYISLKTKICFALVNVLLDLVILNQKFIFYYSTEMQMQISGQEKQMQILINNFMRESRMRVIDTLLF